MDVHVSDVEALQKNTVWKEIVETLKVVKAGLIEDVSTIDPFTQPGVLANKQGRLALLEFFLLQPDAIVYEINAAKQEERKGGK